MRSVPLAGTDSLNVLPDSTFQVTQSTTAASTYSSTWPIIRAMTTSGPLLTQAVSENILNVYCPYLNTNVAADDQSYFHC
jgi:hypothetical protein